MGTAVASGNAIAAGGKDCAQVFVGFGAIPVAVLDAALKPFSQRIMELAISAAESANTTIATDMGVSGKALSRRGIHAGCRILYQPGVPITVLVWHVTLGATPAEN